jgi:hypothetical protein
MGTLTAFRAGTLPLPRVSSVLAFVFNDLGGDHPLISC